MKNWQTVESGLAFCIWGGMGARRGRRERVSDGRARKTLGIVLNLAWAGPPRETRDNNA